MKTLIVASLLLALITPAPAFASTAAIWDCGKGVSAMSDRGEFGVSIGRPYTEDAYPRRGSRRFDLKWDFRNKMNPKVWLSGKRCTETN